ncbi:hypothetical protein [Streptomyces sp. NPDC058955]|uniref:hypothetical protein n=1 Tax=unclassified Streptomyces TaxID=2593676 RepID=UPI003656E801
MPDPGLPTGATSGYKTVVEANLRVANLMQNAYDDILRIRRIVESSNNELTTGYGGTDGRAFYDLLVAWDADVRKVENGLLNVKETMIANSGKQQTAQDTTTSAIQRAQSAFAGLKGPSA